MNIYVKCGLRVPMLMVDEMTMSMGEAMKLLEAIFSKWRLKLPRNIALINVLHHPEELGNPIFDENLFEKI